MSAVKQLCIALKSLVLRTEFSTKQKGELVNKLKWRGSERSYLALLRIPIYEQ